MTLTPYQIAVAFPDECKEYIPKIIPVLEAKLLEPKQRLRYIDSLNITEPEKALYRIFVEVDEVLKIRKRLDTYQKAMKMIADSDDKKIWDERHALACAKAMPIETMYGFQKMRQTSTRISACCPFHDDKTPSFIIYRNTNMYRCFGCQEHGDSIDFYRKINKCSFKEAVKVLGR